MAVDGAGNVYFTVGIPGTVNEIPYAFVDPTGKVESPVAGSDSLPVVLPVTANLRAPLAPTSDQSWLTVTGITNGVVSYTFTANPGPGRTAHISLLGRTISVTQVSLGPPLILIALPTQGNGVFQLAFGYTQNASFTVLSSTNLLLPLTNWTVVGTASNIASESVSIRRHHARHNSQRFYTVRLEPKLAAWPPLTLYRNLNLLTKNTKGGGQKSSLGGQGERIIAFGVLIEPVFPELVQAPTAVDATQRQHVFCAGQGPEHA